MVRSPAARTYQAMVAELVQNAVAHIAYAIRIEQRNPEPPKNRCPKQEGVDIVLLRRRRTMEPSASARNPSKLQVSPARWVAERRGTFNLVEAPFVDASRKLLLAAWLSSRVEGVFGEYRRIVVGCREGHVGGGSVEIERISRIQLSAQCLRRETGGQVGPWAMFRRLSETQTAKGGGKTCQGAVLGRK